MSRADHDRPGIGSSAPDSPAPASAAPAGPEAEAPEAEAPEAEAPEAEAPEAERPEAPDAERPEADGPAPDGEKTREIRVSSADGDVTHRPPGTDPHDEDDAEPPARYDEEEPGGEYEPDTVVRPAGRGRRISSAGAVVALLLGLLGFALVVQLRSNSTDPELSTARPEDLVRILSDLDARQDRLRQEIASLEESQRQLASGAQGREAALAEARRRADELGILAGTLPAQGRGLQVTFVPGGEGIPASTVLDAVEELRGAGAEAMQVSGAGSSSVRIVASTYFTDARDGLVVDDAHLSGPYTLVVIGDPQTMHTALNIPGGVVDTVRQRGGNVIVQESDAIRVTALHVVGAPKFARPVS